MAPAVAQPSMTTGELSPQLYARVDLARYYTGLKTCRNFIVQPYGGIVNRTGSELCASVKDHTKKVRLIPFQFSPSQNYVLEFGERYIRFHRNGGVIRSPLHEELSVTGIVEAIKRGAMIIRPLGLVIPGHPFQDGDTVIVSGVATGIDGTRTVLRIDENTVGIYGLDYISGDLTWSEAGTVSYPEIEGGGDPVEVETPYLEADLPLLKYTQSADVLTICLPRFKQQQLSRLSHYEWTLADFANTEGPFQDINVDESKTIIASAPTGEITLTADFDVFTPDHVGGMLYLEQSPDDNTKKWEVQKVTALNAIRRRGVGYYQAATTGTTGTVPPSVVEGSECDGDPGVKWNYLHSGFGIARITEFTDARHVTAEVIRRIPDQVTESGAAKVVTSVITGTEEIPGEIPIPAVYAKVRVNGHGYPDGSIITIIDVAGATEANGTWTIEVIDANWFYLAGLILTSLYVSGGKAALSTEAVPSYKWAFEAWGVDNGFPGTAIYHQQRQIFGGSEGRPSTIWESRSGGAFLDFGKSNPLLDDDALTITLNSLRVNEIRHFVELRELIALTNEGAWVIKKEQGQPTPVATFQGKGGSAHISPVLVNERALFVLEKGRSIRSLGYFFQSDSYEGRDVTMTASHLFKKGLFVVDWAYQETPFSCVWMVRSDGDLLGLTYMPDQEVVGWHRHDTDGFYESVCSIPEGEEDAVYVVVRRTIGGETKRYVERFAARFVEDKRDSFFVDSGLSYDGRNAGDGLSFVLTNTVNEGVPVEDEWGYRETLLLTMDADFFTGESDEGDAIVVDGTDGLKLKLTILEFVSATEVHVLPDRTVPEDMRETEISGFDLARDTFTGAGHLEGKGVSILADGKVVSRGEIIVTGGGFTIDSPAVVVHAGLPITADAETLDINIQGQSIQDRIKIVRSVTFLVDETKGLQAGQDAEHLLYTAAVPTGTYADADDEISGALATNILSSWTKGGRVFVRHNDPLPATILGIIPEVTTSGA